jgi:hypothetical protein
VTVVGIVAYIGLFHATDQRRLIMLSQLLVPESLVGSWVDHDWSRFGILDHVPVLAGAAIIWLISGLTGWLALRASRADEVFSRGEQFVISLAIGLNLWSLITLLIGLCGGLQQRGLFAGLTCIVMAVAAWQLTSRRRESPRTRPKAETAADQPLTRFGPLALGLCLPLTIVILLGGTLPAAHFDVREYHLQVPKEWFQQGRITFLPHNVYGNMPLGAEMHAILGMLLASGKDNWWWGALIGKTVIAAFAPLGAAGVFFIGRRFVSSDAGSWGAFAYLSTPWIAHVSMTGLIDGAVACYVVASLLVALPAILPDSDQAAQGDGQRSSRLAIAGFLAGGSVACKYPALLFLVAPLGLLVTLLPRRRIDWFSACLFTLGVVAGCGLWFGKNWVQSGNPTYPLLYSVFGGKSWNAEKNARWTKAHGPPLDADGDRFTLAQMWDSATLLALRSDHHGPWLVPLAAAALWTWRVPQRRRLIAILYGITAIAIVSWWLLTHRVDRFLVPMLPLVALGAGIGATWTADSRWRVAVMMLGGWSCLASFVQVASPFGADNRFLIALTDLRSDRPRTKDQITRMNDGHRWLNENVPPGSRALLVGEAQVFDLEVPILYNTCFDDCVLETLLRDRSREERLRVLREQRISHIFVSWYELRRYREPGNYGYSDFPTRELFHDELVAQQRLLKPIPIFHRGEVLEVFELINEPGE